MTRRLRFEYHNLFNAVRRGRVEKSLSSRTCNYFAIDARIHPHWYLARDRTTFLFTYVRNITVYMKYEMRNMKCSDISHVNYSCLLQCMNSKAKFKKKKTRPSIYRILLFFLLFFSSYHPTRTWHDIFLFNHTTKERVLLSKVRKVFCLPRARGKKWRVPTRPNDVLTKIYHMLMNGIYHCEAKWYHGIRNRIWKNTGCKSFVKNILRGKTLREHPSPEPLHRESCLFHCVCILLEVKTT